MFEVLRVGNNWQMSDRVRRHHVYSARVYTQARVWRRQLRRQTVLDSFPKQVRLLLRVCQCRMFWCGQRRSRLVQTQK
jgi:hypothetical protein